MKNVVLVPITLIASATAFASTPVPTAFGPVVNTAPNGATVRAVAESEHLVDIAVYYTDALLAKHGVEGIHAELERQLNGANHALAAHELGIARRIVRFELSGLANNAGWTLDEFKAAHLNERVTVDDADSVGADYITYLNVHQDPNFCGRAKIGGVVSAFALDDDCVRTDLLAAHEWGHNDGALHERGETSSTPKRPSGHPASCGGKATIMTGQVLSAESVHSHYSDRNLVVDGEACGNELQDVALMLHELKSVDRALGNRNDAPAITGSVVIETVNQKVNEGEVVSVSVSSESAGEVQVYTRALDATADLHYQALSHTLTFDSAGTQTVEIPTVAIDGYHGDVSFEVGLRYPVALSIESEATTVVIAETDEPARGVFDFTQEARTVEAGSGTITITVKRSDGSDTAETVQLALTSGNAIELNETTIEFKPGQTTGSVTATVGSVDVESKVVFQVTAPEGTEGTVVTQTITVKPKGQSGGESSGGAFGTISALLLLLFSAWRRR